MDQQEETKRKIPRRTATQSKPSALKMDDQQEETKRTIPRRTTTQSKPSASSFPDDLTSEVLIRLPLKSVVRLRCVSKVWSKITTEPYFTKSRYSTLRQSFLLFFKKGDTLFVFSIPQDDQNSNESFPSIGRYQMKSPEHSFVYPTESVHGLICFQDSGNPTIWNPTTRQFLSLPKPEESWEDISCFLGYDPSRGEHKVMCMPSKKICDECRILTLGSEEHSWRLIKTKHKHLSTKGCYGRCINGVVYYKAYLDHSRVRIIMSFDINSEKFDVMTLPTDIFPGMLIPYEGRLACVATGGGGIKLWILEDTERKKWSCKHFLAHDQLPYDTSFKSFFHLDGITDAGEFIYVPWESEKPFYVLYFDPRRNRFREIEFAEEEFRLSNGLGDRLLGNLHSCMHHTESLLSL